MPAGPRIRSNSEFGLITDNSLTAGATSFNSARLSLFPVVSSAHAVVTLDPRAINGEPEIVIITAHTAAATVATITRGAYGTVARSHPVATEWIHAPVDEDFIEVLTSSTRPSDPYRGQMIFETDTNRFVNRTTADAWQQLHLSADPPACRVFKNVDTSFTSNVFQVISFTSERYDTDNMWVIGSPTRVTFNTAGLYSMSLDVSFAARNDYEGCFAGIIKNNAAFLALQTTKASVVGTMDIHLSVSTINKVVAGDYIEAHALQRNTAAAAANLKSSAQYSPELSVCWLGRG